MNQSSRLWYCSPIAFPLLFAREGGARPENLVATAPFDA